MSVEIRHIKAFVTVATELHSGRAAQKLNVAQPALSRSIQSASASCRRCCRRSSSTGTRASRCSSGTKTKSAVRAFLPDPSTIRTARRRGIANRIFSRCTLGGNFSV